MFNDLKKINVSRNIKLEYLIISQNQIDEINLSNNHNLKYLALGGYKGKYLDFSNNKKLNEIHIIGADNLKEVICCNENQIKKFQTFREMFELNYKILEVK